MIKYIVLILSLSFGIANAAEKGVFTHYPANIKEYNTIGFVDLSKFSIEWLEKNASYLIEKEVPIVVIDATEQKVSRLREKYNGKLLVGSAPEPVSLMSMLFEYLGVKNYPAVVEKGVIWQVRPGED